MGTVDIAVIGSGAASTTTLIELFTRLIENNQTDKKLHITVIEKYQEFWKGVPYGTRSSVNSLTITPIADFISKGKEKELFFDWFSSNLDEIVENYRSVGGLTAEKWIADNRLLLKNAEWDKVYVPRHIFGNYMQKKLLSLLNNAVDKHLLQVDLIQAEAIDIDHHENGVYDVILEHPDKTRSTITAKKVVVATGSAPVKVYATENDTYTYINEVYEPTLNQNLETLYQTLSATPNIEDRNVLLIGSNASSIELLYLLSNRPDIISVINKIVSISRKGSMPHHIAETPLADYPCKHLDEIKAANNYDIHSLVAAAKKDIEHSIKNGVVIVPYVDRIVGYTIELMHILGEEARKIFFGTYGMQLTRLIRRSGPAYKNASETLLNTHKLQLLKGEFTNVLPTPAGALLRYTNEDTQQTDTFDHPFKVVINCTGSDDLQYSSSRLIYNLVNKNISSTNLSGKGFLVNENFEAAPNLYVIGPLLGGNMNKTIYFWHIENLARLLYLAPFLADRLLAE